MAIQQIEVNLQWEKLWNLAEIAITWRYDNFLYSENINRPCCYVWKIEISSSKHRVSHFERVNTHYQSLQIWIGLNETSYHNLNALPQALPYILYEISMVLGYLQRVTIIFFEKKINKCLFINLTLMHSKALELAPNLWYFHYDTFVGDV